MFSERKGYLLFMSTKTILIVENDPNVRHGYHVCLKGGGYETHFASDVLTGLTEAKRIQPDLIILDLGLRSGDGFTFMERLRTNVYLSMIPIVVVSPSDHPQSRERALKAGAMAYPHKPVINDKLLTIINQALGETIKAQRT